MRKMIFVVIIIIIILHCIESNNLNILLMNDFHLFVLKNLETISFHYEPIKIKIEYDFS